MENKELLTYAAKAANYTLKKWCSEKENEFFIALLPVEGQETNYPEIFSEEYWNPLLDSGDALKLATRIGFDITIDNNELWVSIYYKNKNNFIQSYSTPYEIGNVNIAIRKAITTLAAKIGETIN